MQNYYRITGAVENSVNGVVVLDNRLYGIIEKLTNSTYPTMLKYGDKRWIDFYAPVKRDKKIIAFPFGVTLYENKFFVSFENAGQIEVRKEENKEKIHSRKMEDPHEKEMFVKLLMDTISFIPKIEKNPKILDKLVPYDLREGKVKRKYIDKELMPLRDAEKIKQKYRTYKRKMGRIKGCSLNEYLNTASICYKSVFFNKINNLTSQEMYLKIADGRHGGMLDIEDKDSIESFRTWYGSERWTGSHPFEIVFSWIDHGIHLYPPSNEQQYYTLRVTNLLYAEKYVGMAEGLIDNNVSFLAVNLKKAIDYLTGELYLGVNSYEYGTLPVYVSTKKEKEFKYVEWKPLKVVKFKKHRK